MRNNSGLTPINYCFDSKDNNLPRILKHAAYLRELDRKFQSKLPLALRGLCSIANIRENLLVVICYSQLEASKVRMHSRVILQIIQQDFKITAKKLKIIIESS
ncbi:hypothetical protein MNBD_GAMMA01-981 [hydrothermal vent metagenome]|uniref:DUF721 domain-containing protein n=1 Tax=hydrothermal vent metagenome TaxID=652676 RepID=A0A3B0VHT6_9ZZZZ